MSSGWRKLQIDWRNHIGGARYGLRGLWHSAEVWERISVKFTIIDGHNDSLLRLKPFTKDRIDSFLNGVAMAILIFRAREGGVAASFFAVL